MHEDKICTFYKPFAEIAGIKAALVLDQIITNLAQDDTNGPWVPCPVSGLVEQMDGLLTTKEVRTALDKLTGTGLIERKRLSSDPRDHTMWYRLTDKASDLISQGD